MGLHGLLWGWLYILSPLSLSLFICSSYSLFSSFNVVHSQGYDAVAVSSLTQYRRLTRPCRIALSVFLPRVLSLLTIRLHTASDRCTACMTSCNMATPRDLSARRFIDPGQAMSRGQVTAPPCPNQMHRSEYVTS
jgi:hypothetical protein